MLFNSYVFVFLFLPITFLVFLLLGRRGYMRACIIWLTLASMFFYAYWNPGYLLIILVSILFNFAVGRSLVNPDPGRQAMRFYLLVLGIAVNLSLLGYFKYANFLVDNLNVILSTQWDAGTILLPLAISFFTFQQITYLVDAYRRETREVDFAQYCLFVTFFPQLIAGPIVHHGEMLPQFARKVLYRVKSENLAVGSTIFVLGLAKKVILADNVARYATPVFDAAAAGTALSPFEAWAGALAFTLQLYFDFSGYSDMAIGLGRIFGIVLPLNFNSPYKAINVIEFWRRWHMTLSRFLRDYLYIPLGGNRRGPARRYANLVITMLLGGLWHGAGWTFVVWGGLHGLYLMVNYGWHALRVALGGDLRHSTRPGRAAARLLTFLAVVIGWVFFRAESFASALHILGAMVRFSAISLPKALHGRLGALESSLANHGIAFNGMFPNDLVPGAWSVLWITVLLTIAWFAPNTQEIMARYKPALGYRQRNGTRATGSLLWRPSLRWAFTVAVLSFVSILHISSASEFLYFNF